MSEKIIVGYWDCRSCGAKKIRGTNKKCPNCGAPMGDTKCYIDVKNKEYLDDKTSKDYGKGPNWICPYCENQNRYYSQYCEGCGAPKADSTEDYFQNNPNETIPKKVEEHSSSYYSRSSVLERETARKEKKYADSHSYNDSNRTSEEDDAKGSSKLLTNLYNFFSKNKKRILIGFFSIITFVSFIFILIPIVTPHTYTATVTSNSWKRTISIEEYKTVRESDWTVPPGGRVYRMEDEFHHYNHVLDHYDTITVTKSRQVIDHYDTHVEYAYSDNGDGTFTEHSYIVSDPVYRTEYYTETEQKPVYVDIPVYETKYYYEIEKWVYNRTEEASGKDDSKAYWPEYHLSANERVSSKNEVYFVIFTTEKKDYKKEVSESELYLLKLDTEVEITVQAGIVTKFEILTN